MDGQESEVRGKLTFYYTFYYTYILLYIFLYTFSILHLVSILPSQKNF